MIKLYNADGVKIFLSIDDFNEMADTFEQDVFYCKECNKPYSLKDLVKDSVTEHFYICRHCEEQARKDIEDAYEERQSLISWHSKAVI